jgi:iron complex outermembrane receptor protein
MNNLPMARGIAVAMSMACAPAAHAALLKVADIADLSLEQLTRVTVTTVSRREEKVLDAPASIFVITTEDIRRSGATTLPEVLRLAPNLQVVRADTSQYIVTARGGLAGTANKMLVLIDGRTVYTPLFAGVFWDAQNAMIEDIERIEVISGPGSTLWGTNAVNGVINIISKSSSATRGVLAAVGGGNQERGASVRAGGAVEGGGSFRVYGKYFDRRDHPLSGGASARDDSDRWQVGFRADRGDARESATFQGDLYHANVDNLDGARDLSGANLLGRWRRGEGSGDEWYAQAYYDRTEREHLGTFKEKRDTLDVEVHRALRYADRHQVVWGAGQRFSRDNTQPTQTLGFVPAQRTLSLTSLFVQDEIALTKSFDATFGLRAERNVYTGVEWLPNARVSYAVAPGHVVWSALSRAVRAPSRIDRDLVVPGTPPFVITSNDTVRSEIANVAELGYRATLSPRASISLTAFHHDMRRLRSLESGPAGLVLANGVRGRVSGLEGWGDWTATPDWRLVWGFVLQQERSRPETGHVNLTSDPLGNDPRRTASLRSLWNVSREHELDLTGRYMGALPNPKVPSYSLLDARWGWRLSRELELSLLVANAFNREHVEFTPITQAALLGRAYFLKVTWSP